MSKPSELILLPGLLCDRELWSDQLAVLGTVLPCHVADLTRGDTISDLADVVLGMTTTDFLLAGFSFGGYVAQEVVRKAPKRVKQLALLDTSFREETPERRISRNAMAEAVRQIDHFEGITDRMLQNFVHPGKLRDVMLTSRIKTMAQRVGRDVYVRQSSIQRQDGEATLRSLDCPVLVLCGRQDAVTPLQDHEKMATFVPGASLTIVEACGHMAPMEQPDAVTYALCQWLGRN